MWKIKIYPILICALLGMMFIGNPVFAHEKPEIFHFQKAWINEHLDDFDQVLQNAKAVPISKENQTYFQFKYIKSGSFYEDLGLRKNDILVSLDDTVIDDWAKAMGIFEKLKSERKVALTIEREGKQKSFHYYIK